MAGKSFPPADRALPDAARYGDVPTVRAALTAGANPEARDEEGCAPPLRAVLADEVAAAEVLVGAGAGADVDADATAWAMIALVQGCAARTALFGGLSEQRPGDGLRALTAVQPATSSTRRRLTARLTSPKRRPTSLRDHATGRHALVASATGPRTARSED
ncbi:hypothetical protein [Streptomyces sp. NPDC059781]|uniref:hypothetical protein n=1 Tax=Streptomyces sp. NPDC059781 TaxID=3346943 RepID=UPI00364FCF11